MTVLWLKKLCTYSSYRTNYIRSAALFLNDNFSQQPNLYLKYEYISEYEKILNVDIYRGNLQFMQCVSQLCSLPSFLFSFYPSNIAIFCGISNSVILLICRAHIYFLKATLEHASWLKRVKFLAFQCMHFSLYLSLFT